MKGKSLKEEQMKTMVSGRPVGSSTRRFVPALVIALTAAALVPAAAAAGLWDGKWKIHVQGGKPGKMCLDQTGGVVVGKFQSEDPGKFGTIGGELSGAQKQHWNGGYRDRGTGDKGKFHATIGEAARFDGWFKPNSADRRYDWGGHQVDFDGSYERCLAQIKQ